MRKTIENGEWFEWRIIWQKLARQRIKISKKWCRDTSAPEFLLSWKYWQSQIADASMISGVWNSLLLIVVCPSIWLYPRSLRPTFISLSPPSALPLSFSLFLSPPPSPSLPFSLSLLSLSLSLSLCHSLSLRIWKRKLITSSLRHEQRTAY